MAYDVRGSVCIGLGLPIQGAPKGFLFVLSETQEFIQNGGFCKAHGLVTSAPIRDSLITVFRSFCCMWSTGDINLELFINTKSGSTGTYSLMQTIPWLFDIYQKCVEGNCRFTGTNQSGLRHPWIEVLVLPK